MKIKQLEKPKLQNIKMNCDNIIHKKLTEFPMVNDAWSTNSYNIVCGTMGSGKTSLLTNLVKCVFNKCFENIYVIMPSNSRASIENDIFGKNLPPDQLYDTLTPENLYEIYEKLQENSDEGYNSLLIIDDFQAQLKEPEIVKTLQKIITKMRHLRTTVFLLQQNFQALVKPLRQLVSNLIIFNLGKSALSFIFEEIVQMDKKKTQDLINISFQESHDWILINFHRSKKIYKMFDEIQIEDE